MRKRLIGAALSLAVATTPLAIATPAAAQVCIATAFKPQPVVIDGTRYVRSEHNIKCADDMIINVTGRLKMDGTVVNSDSRQCFGDTCTVFVKNRDPFGDQTWVGRTVGTGGGASVPADNSPPLES